MDRDSYYVTTPIYYVNDKPHIGHAYTTILADVLARYHRLAGIRTHFLTGTDEHGQKVQEAAAKAGITPRQQADRTVVRFQALWERLGITHDDFIRTTEARHTAVVQDILRDLYDRGEIYEAEYDGWYDVTSETFVTEKDLEQATTAGVRPVNIVRIRERNYFFRMSRYRDWLIDYIHTHPRFIQPDFRRNETLGFLKKPLNDLCISRPKSRLSWGIELPFDGDFVTYVWFDALVNYISAVGYRRDEARFRQWWPASCHLIGKDILTTHTVYWPTMLKAMGVAMPETIFAHGWWLIGRDKMSKTTGNVVNPMEVADAYGVDAFRYFVMREMTMGQDASFTEAAFVRRYNADLANDLGNMLSRVLKLVTAHCDGAIPSPRAGGEDEARLRDAALGAARTVLEQVGNMRIDQGLEAVGAVVREANRYMEIKQPWTLIKQGEREAFEGVMYTACETLRVVSGLLHPVMPEKMEALRGALGLAGGTPDYASLATWGVLQPGTRVTAVRGLFPRIAEKPDASPPEADAAATGAAARPDGASGVEEGIMRIDYADFEKVELRTARIVAAEPVKGADKLLRLEIELGEERRQIVAGIAQHYDAAALPGRIVVVVANLKPARIRGVESNGMLLAASSGGRLQLVTVDGEVASGATVR